MKELNVKVSGMDVFTIRGNVIDVLEGGCSTLMSSAQGSN